MKIARTFCVLLVGVAGLASPASADWLLTGYVAPLFNVKTSAATGLNLPAERFDDSVGIGVNVASAFPSRGNLGFELDWSWHQKALRTSDVFATSFASRLMSISTNFFYSPAIPWARPYFSVGPSFHYRMDDALSTFAIPSGWAFGINGGAGVMVFATNRFGARIDARYFRNFGAFYDLRSDVIERNSGWNDLQSLRVFAGVTVVL
jgi:outer membrane protein with beta-barrel domain